ncbi:class I SAM-dependent methyltransferase [Chloroflexota bacterium]
MTRILATKDSAEDIFIKIERKKRVYSQILNLLEGKEGLSLLDVGCSTGNFLLSCKREGFQPVVGIEICKTRATFAARLGLTVFNCQLEEATLPDRSFDIITYLETLEHISTPVNELREAYRILRNGGIIVVEVPNVTFQLLKAKVSRLLHIGHYGLIPDIHLVHFTERTIKTALAKAGFVSIETTLRTHYLREKLPIHIKVLSILLHYFAKFVRSISGLNIGSAIITVAEKVDLSP